MRRGQRTCSTPSTRSEPGEKERQERKDDGANEGSAATRTRTGEESRDDEQADGVEGEEGANEARDQRDNATQRSPPVASRSIIYPRMDVHKDSITIAL